MTRFDKTRFVTLKDRTVTQHGSVLSPLHFVCVSHIAMKELREMFRSIAYVAAKV